MWGPSYRNSFAINISSFGLAIVLVLVLRFYLAHLNRKMDADESTPEVHDHAVEAAAKIEGISRADAVAARKAFRYLL